MERNYTSNSNRDGKAHGESTAADPLTPCIIDVARTLDSAICPRRKPEAVITHEETLWFDTSSHIYILNTRQLKEDNFSEISPSHRMLSPLVSALACFFILYAAAVDPVVDLSYASYRGVANDSNGVSHWLGMRYAAPPLGNLRFAAPVDPPVANGVQDASSVS